MKRSALLVAMLLTVLPASSRAATLRVEADGSGDFTSIQFALDAAASGDTVLVGPGVWSEHLTAEGRWLTLMGREGAEATVLEGGYDGRLLTVVDSGQRFTVAGFTFAHGLQNSQDFPGNAGGAIAAFHANLTVRDCVFRENVVATPGPGGAIYATARTVPGVSHTPPQPALSPEIEIDDCTFDDNLCGDEGGAVFIDDSETAITGSTFNRNSAVQGGAISQVSRPLTVTGCRFEGNHSRRDGGALLHTATQAAPVALSDCVFLDNRTVDPAEGGALKVKGLEALTITRCAFLRGSSWQGAGAYLQTASLRIDHTLWLANTAEDRGGALYLLSPAGAVLTRCTWIANAAGHAASIYVDQGSFEVDSSIIEDADPNAVLCHTATGTGSCLVGGGDTGAGCLGFYAIEKVGICPTDSLNVCVVPAGLACGMVGHSDEPCGGPGCQTPVEAVSWGTLKQRYR